MSNSSEPRSKPLPAWRMLPVFLCLAVSARAEVSQPSRTSPSVTGFWVKQLPVLGRSLTRCEDGRRAWLFDKETSGVSVIDDRGEVLFSAPQIKTITDATVLKATGQGCNAWILQPSFGACSVWRLMDDGTRITLSSKIDVPARKPTSCALYTGPSGARAYVVENGPATTSIHRVDLLAGGVTSRTVTTVMPLRVDEMFVPESGKPWVLQEDNPWRVALMDETSGRLEPVTTASGAGRVQPVDGARVFLLATKSGVSPLDGQGKPLHGAKPLLNVTDPSELEFRVQGARTWLTTSTGVYLLNPDATLANDGGPLLQGGHQLRLVPGGAKAWATSDTTGELTLLDGEHPGRPVRLPAQVNAPAKLLSSLDGSRHWIEAQSHQLYLADADGNLLNDGKPLLGGTRARPLALIEGGKALLAANIAVPGTSNGVFVLDREGRPMSESSERLSRFSISTPPWLQAGSVVYALRMTDEVGPYALKFAGHTFDASTRGAKLSTTDVAANFDVDVSLEWPGKADALKHDGEVTLHLRAAGKEPNADAILKVKDGKASGQWVIRPEWNHTYDLVLTYQDELGSHFEVTWPGVQFVQPWWEKPWVRTCILFAGLLLVFVLLFSLRSLSPVAARWLPMAVWLATEGSSFGLSDWLKNHSFDGTLLAQLGFGALLFFVTVGFLSPALFRVLASTAPFDRFAPLAFALPWSRRRLLSGYAAEVERILKRERQSLDERVYVPVPAKVSGHGEPGSRLEAAPAVFIRDRLTATDDKSADVFIESPGGRGKSALYREVVQLLLQRFRTERRAPLPVLCRGKGDSLEGMVEGALGKHLYAKGLLKPLLASGDFVLVFDGLTESGIEPRAIETFLRSDVGQATRVFATTRPNGAYRAAMRASERLVELEPQPLDDATLSAFVRAYRAAAQQPAHDAGKPPFPPAVLAVCRGPDGLYLPILVRLAMLLDGDGVAELGDLYERAISRLLQNDAALLDETAALCVETYWKTGIRPLAMRGEPESRRKLLQQLLDANLLMSSDGRGLPGSEPREVRFFHDSLQSYLTALGLFKQDRWDVLSEAAGHPRFVEASGTSEVFRMAVEVFRPLVQLRAALRDELSAWASTFDSALRKDDVIAATPAALHEALKAQFAPEARYGAGDLLRAAVALCEQHREGEEIHLLANLYEGLAPIVHEAKKRGAPPTPAALQSTG